MEILIALDTIASILTTIIAAMAAGYYFILRRSKRIKLEKYMKSKKLEKTGNFQHTALQLMAELGMTEAEVFHASADSPNIRRKPVWDRSSGLAKDILFEYVDEPQ